MTQLNSGLFQQNKQTLAPGGAFSQITPPSQNLQSPATPSSLYEGLDAESLQAMHTMPRSQREPVQEGGGKLTEFGKAIRRGFLTLSSDAKFLGAALVDLFGAEGARDALIKSALESREDIQSERLRASIGGVQDISSVADAGTFVLSSIAEQFPNILLLFGSGGFGGATAKALAKRVATKQAGKALGQKLGQKSVGGMVELAQKAGTISAATAVSVGMETGTIGLDIAEFEGKFKPGVALSFGTAAGGLDVLPFMPLFKKVGIAKGAKKFIMDDLVKKGAMGTVIKGGAKQFFYEGSTEAVQTAIENSALKYVNDRHTVFEGKELEFLNAFTIGGIVGGALGGVSAKVEHSKAVTDLKKLHGVQSLSEIELNAPITDDALSPEQVIEEKKLRNIERGRGIAKFEPQDMAILPKNKNGETVLDVKPVQEMDTTTLKQEKVGNFTIHDEKGMKIGKKPVMITKGTALDGTPDRIARITFPKGFTEKQQFAFLFYNKQVDKDLGTKVSRMDQFDLRVRLFDKGLVASEVALEDAPEIRAELPPHESVLLGDEVKQAREAIKKSGSSEGIIEFYQDSPILTEEAVALREAETMPKYPEDKIIEGISTKMSFWKQVSQTAPNLVRSLAPVAGGKLATRLESIAANSREKTIKANRLHKKTFGKLNKNERKAALLVLRGKGTTANEKVNKAVKAAQGEMELMKRLAKFSKFMVTTPELFFIKGRNADRREMSMTNVKDGQYRMLTKAARRQLNEGKGPLFNEMVMFTRKNLPDPNGKPLTPDEARSALMVQYATDGVSDFAPLERKLLFELPEKFFESDAQAFFDNFSAQFWKRYYEINNFGYSAPSAKPIRPMRPNSNELARAEIMEEIELESGKAAKKTSQEVFNEVVGQIDRSALMRKLEDHFLKPMRMFNAVRLLGLSPSSIIKQGTQMVVGMSKFGLLNFTQSVYGAVSGAVTNSKDFQTIIESGAVDPNTLSRVVQGEGANTGVQKVLEKAAGDIYRGIGVLTPFKMGDQAGRLIAAQQGLTSARGHLKLLKSGKIPAMDRINFARWFNSESQIKGWARDALQELGIQDVDRVLKHGDFTGKDLKTIAQKSADMLLFQTGPTDLPKGWSGNPLLRTVFQFYTFAWKQGRLASDFVTKEALGRNNPLPLMRLVVGSQAAGHLAIGLMRSLSKDERAEATETQEFINNFIFVGTWGIIMDAFTADYEQVRVGPTGDLVQSLIRETGNVLGAANGDVFKQLSASAKKLLKTEVTVLRVLNKATRDDGRAAYDGFIRKLATAKKQSRATGVTAEVGVFETSGQSSRLWEAVSDGAMGRDSYNKFELEMKKKVRSTGTIEGVVKGLISSKAPAEMYVGMDLAERQIFSQRYGQIKDAKLQKQLHTASAHHVVASMKAWEYYRRFLTENKTFIREQLTRRGK